MARTAPVEVAEAVAVAGTTADGADVVLGPDVVDAVAVVVGLPSASGAPVRDAQ
jgi:hypothetical protein